MPSPRSDGFSMLVRASDKTRNAALLRATTELYALDSDHNPDQNRRFEELVLHLLPDALISDRIFVAERLADVQDAPVAVLRSLATDDIAVARPILTRSTALGAFELLSVLAATEQEHREVIARREELPDEVRQALAASGHTAAGTDADNPPDHDIHADIPPDLTAVPPPAPDLALSSGAQAFLDMDRGARLRAIASIANGSLARAASDRTAPEAFEQIVSAAQIIGYARAQKSDQMIAAISRSLDLPEALVRASVEDETGEPLAILLKALRLDDVTAQQVFLVMSPVGRDVSRFFPISDLYSGMEPVVAEAIVARWRDSEPGVDTGAKPVTHESPMQDIASRREPRLHERQRPAGQAQPFGRANRRA